MNGTERTEEDRQRSIEGFAARDAALAAEAKRVPKPRKKPDTPSNP